MTRSLLEKYQVGMINDGHLVVESLRMVDPNDPAVVLTGLPDNILSRMLQFAKEYQAGSMVTNYGILPAQDQVVAAQRWIEKALQQKAGVTA